MNNMQPVEIFPGQAVFFEKILNPRRIADLDRLATDNPPHGGVTAERRIRGRGPGFLNWQTSDIGGIMIPLS
jgi:hypothetical protein